MNYNQAFADAARPSRAVVLRLLMLPYSIGHEIQLTQEGNALLAPWDVFNSLTAGQQCYSVARAAQICCRTWRENQNKPIGRWFLKRWRFYNRNADYALEIANFRNYRAAGSTFPAIGKPDGDGRVLGSPFMARLLAFAGMENIDMPLGMAQWMYFATAEADGSCKVLNDHEQQVQSELEQIKSHGLPAEEKERIDKLMREAMAERGVQCPP